MEAHMRWAVIENAGYEGEWVAQTDFATEREAWKWAHERYQYDEMQEMHVDVAHWDDDQECWSYDYY